MSGAVLSTPTVAVAEVTALPRRSASVYCRVYAAADVELKHSAMSLALPEKVTNTAGVVPTAAEPTPQPR